MPTATLSFVLRSTEVLVSTEVLPGTCSTTSVWKTINDNFSGLVSWHFPQRFQAVWNKNSFQVLGGAVEGLVSPLRAQPQMTKLHHELGLVTLVSITSEVIIEVPAVGSVVSVGVGVGPGRFQPVQVVDQRLHHLLLHELAARSLNRCWMSLPTNRNNYIYFPGTKYFPIFA